MHVNVEKTNTQRIQSQYKIGAVFSEYNLPPVFLKKSPYCTTVINKNKQKQQLTSIQIK